jgi:CheY-like chemotaxis protein
MQSLRLMVVDADDFAATLTGAALSDLGHHVEKYASAEVALEALHAVPGGYDAILARRTLDTMTASQFAREAQANDAALAIIPHEARTPGLVVLGRSQLLTQLGAAMGRLCGVMDEALALAA